MAKTRQITKPRVRDSLNKARHSMNPDRLPEKSKSGGRVRDRSTIKRFLMYKNFKPKRDKVGKIVRPAPFQSWVTSGTQARVEPNQRWFGNTKVITQGSLQKFQDELGKAINDPYQVVMRQTKLPICLLNEKPKNLRVHLLDTEGFECTFGPKSTRKRPNLKTTDLEEMVSRAAGSTELYDADKDADLMHEQPDSKEEARESIMYAGQSKRIWGELYKVIDSSDVVVQVLDARDPMGTRSTHIETFLKKEKPFKHLFFILNKCDLVPTWATQKWVAILSQEYPSLAFRASITNPFGKGALINLLRQFGKLHQDKKQISVGFIGYPNVGKSSIINALRAKKVCKVAPIAGETKVWQYITLMRRMYLIDCPGVVYPTDETDSEKVLKGVVRVELVKQPEDYIVDVLARVKPEYIKKTYNLDDWEDAEDFLRKLAQKSGKLLKKGEPDISTVAKMVLNDWQRGKLPYFVLPPGSENTVVDESTIISTSEGQTVEAEVRTTLDLETNKVENNKSETIQEPNDKKVETMAEDAVQNNRDLMNVSEVKNETETSFEALDSFTLDDDEILPENQETCSKKEGNGNQLKLVYNS